MAVSTTARIAIGSVGSTFPVLAKCIAVGTRFMIVVASTAQRKRSIMCACADSANRMNDAALAKLTADGEQDRGHRQVEHRLPDRQAVHRGPLGGRKTMYHNAISAQGRDRAPLAGEHHRAGGTTAKYRSHQGRLRRQPSRPSTVSRTAGCATGTCSDTTANLPRTRPPARAPCGHAPTNPRPPAPPCESGRNTDRKPCAIHFSGNTEPSWISGSGSCLSGITNTPEMNDSTR